MTREACLRLSQTEVLQSPVVKALNDACEEITRGYLSVTLEKKNVLKPGGREKI